MEGKKSLKIKVRDLPESLTGWVGSTSSLIAHSIVFALFFILGFLGVDWEMLLIVLTTAVSLEAIYLAIFIQMSVNKTSISLAEVEEDIEDIAEDVGEIAEDVEDIAEDVEEIQTDVDELQEDVEEIQVDVSDIQKDIDDIQGDVDELSDDLDDIAKGDKKVEKRDLAQKELLKNIHKNMNRVKSDLEKLRAVKKKTLNATPPVGNKKIVKPVSGKAIKKILKKKNYKKR